MSATIPNCFVGKKQPVANPADTVTSNAGIALIIRADQRRCAHGSGARAKTTIAASAREELGMTSSQLQNDWCATKGKFQQKFGQLTDDDLTFAQGMGEELLATLQERPGLSRDEFNATFDELMSSDGGAIGQVKAKATEVSRHVRARAGPVVDDLKHRAATLGEEAKVQGAAAYHEARVRVRGLWEDGEEYVRTNPRESLLAAVAAGFVAGLLLLRR